MTRLNLPLLDELTKCRHLLIAGMGGGFDLFCGLPIYHELRRFGVNIHLANLTFTRIEFAKSVQKVSQLITGVTADTQSVLLYFPELRLAQFLRNEGDDQTIWCFHADNAPALLQAYRALIETLNIDGILLMDGGVDSLMRGDEAQIGTVLEDGFSLAAIDELSGLQFRRMACLGFGTEQDVSHGHVLENIAALMETGAFLGSCALSRHMDAFTFYEQAVAFAHNARGQEPSVVQSSVVAATHGHYGNFHATEKTRDSRLHLSPLMPLYWFFDVPGVAARNLFLPGLRRAPTRRDALAAIAQIRTVVPVRRPAPPLFI